MYYTHLYSEIRKSIILLYRVFDDSNFQKMVIMSLTSSLLAKQIV